MSGIKITYGILDTKDKNFSVDEILAFKFFLCLFSDSHLEKGWSYKYDRNAQVRLITSSETHLLSEYKSPDKRFVTLLAKM